MARHTRYRSASTAASSPPSKLVTATATLLLLLLALAVFALQLLTNHTRVVRRTNTKRRNRLIKQLGLPSAPPPPRGREGGAPQQPHPSASSTSTSASRPPNRWRVVGFFHPFCNAGGGGERVLFQAIHHLLSTQPDVVCVVYTGDVVVSASLRAASPEASGADGSAATATTASANIPAQGTTPTTARLDNAASKHEILAKCRARFDVDLVTPPGLASRVHFLPLTSRRLVSDGYWSRLTMLGQAWGAAVLGWQACEELVPDFWIDTMGYAFAYPVFRLFVGSVPIGAYVHYPMISTDMVRRVRLRQAGHTNEAGVASSAFRSHVKLIYYRLFARLYAWCLGRADVLVCNGSWTRDHVESLVLGEARASRATRVRKARREQQQQQRGGTKGEAEKGAAETASKGSGGHGEVEIVYPPCETSELQRFPLEPRQNVVVSLAQFRPEKEHATQLRILAALFELAPELRRATPAVGPPQEGRDAGGVKLVMMGSCRDAGDQARVASLKRLAVELDIEDNVEFVVNAPWAEVVERLGSASVGLSTMVDEHFGINVVEFMAAGLITLSHASAGPLLDIAVPMDGRPTGYHARTVPEFASHLRHIFSADGRPEGTTTTTTTTTKSSSSLTTSSWDEERAAMRAAARERAVGVFGTEAFRRAWDDRLWSRLVESARRRRGWG